MTSELDRARIYISELEANRNNNNFNGELEKKEQIIVKLNISIQELTIQIKEYLIQINALTAEKGDIEVKYAHLEQLFLSTKE